MLYDDLEGHLGDLDGGGEEAQERGDICTIMDDLHCCMAETITTL